MAASEPQEPQTPLPDRATPVSKKLTPYFLLLPGGLALIVFFVLPILSLVNSSLTSGGLEEGYTFTWSFSNYWDVWTEYWPQFLRSFVYAGLATILTILIAYPLAYTIAFKVSSKVRPFLLVLIIAPFLTSFLIRTLAWTTILADEGAFTSFLRGIGFLSITDLIGLTNDQRILATPLAVIMGLTYNFLPFMTLPLYASLEKQDRNLLQAAGDLYASSWTSFWKITWPLSLPGVVSGTLLTFIPAAGDYVNATFLGSMRESMSGNVIDALFLRVRDYSHAAALSISLMVAIVVLVIYYVRRAGTEELV
ncbi:ABC transporter permease subunit [Nakamurella sp. YIM 132087]|uniref:ABC transporter permease subunit n=1 Tax=Nakamurella alba TaxID=2665158 RepID=A0A7K1FN41_9ACTN|nr:ABC transporter permease subunit [Nakamurella alba]